MATETNQAGNENQIRNAAKPSLIVLAGIFCSALSLVLGLIIGISALAVNDGFQANSGLAADILFHPDLMVFGVIGGLLITEKLELMENFRIVRGIRISRPTVTFLFTGVFAASLGIFYDNNYVRFAGLALIVAASMLFLYYMTSSRNPGQPWTKRVFGASIGAMILAAIANMGFLIVGNTTITYLALLFPIIYVLAERIELGFVRGMKEKTIMIQAFIAWASVILAFFATELGGNASRIPVMYASIILVTLFVGISVRFDPAFRKGKRTGRFQSFMRFGVILSYLWLVLGLILFALQMKCGSGFLDPAAHSIALGFIGTFIVAHSPVIFPLTLKKRAIQNNVSFMPLVMLTVSNVMRVSGDLIARITALGNYLSYLSGYVILLAIIAFVYNLRRIMAAPITQGEEENKSLNGFRKI